MPVLSPSTEWAERIAPDEDARFQRHAEALLKIQRTRNKRERPGRALHRKPHAGLRAEVHINRNLPPELAVGIAAEPGNHDAYARFSNGLHRTMPDFMPDLRGLAVKILDVPGPKVIPGLPAATTQDLLCINVATIPFRDVDEFFRFLNAAKSPAFAGVRVLGRFGPRRGTELLRHLLGLGRTPSLAGLTYHGAAPVRWGDHAAKYSLTPIGDEHKHRRRGTLAEDLGTRLRLRPLSFALGVQLFRNETLTPIENPTVEWSPDAAPVTQVGILTLPQQDIDSAEGLALAAEVEAMSFDPWHALEAHRPLGEIMRARSVAYRLSTQERGVSAEPGMS